MSGNRIGGLKCKAKNLAKDPDFYAKIGSTGGKNSNNGGFASDVIGKDGLTGKQRSVLAGSIGGHKSRRVSKKNTY